MVLKPPLILASLATPNFAPYLVVSNFILSKVGARSIVPLLNRRNDENGTFYEAINFKWRSWLHSFGSL